MLERLYVKDFALIDETDVEFSNGLNVLSGETGAGKSLIIGALGFVLGGKADRDSIKRGCEKTYVRAFLRIENEDFAASLRNNELPIDEDGCILIERSFSINGKSGCKINGKAVTVGMLREVAAYLIDIHGQHDHQSLLNPKKHIELLDRLCQDRLEPCFKHLLELIGQYSAIRKELKEVDVNGKELKDKVENYKFSLERINAVDLKPGEDKELSEKRDRLANSVRLKQLAQSALEKLYSAENGTAAELIGSAGEDLNKLSSIDESCTELSASLENISALLDDAVYSLNSYLEKFDVDEGLLDTIEERLQEINNLKKKYGDSIEQILKRAEEMSEFLDKIAHSEQLAKELKVKRSALLKEIAAVCDDITEIRREYALKTSTAVQTELHDLGMENARFEISVRQKETFDRSGRDEVEFLISANKGEELKPLSKIASGGEMSRVMLALKTVLAEVDSIETFIFDEIDTGISGRTAQKVAEKMHIVAKKHQLLCITHLPQIAAMADYNYLIEKTVLDEKTRTDIRLLSDSDVYKEIARLIGGSKITEATLKAAEEMKMMNKS